jgi:hypothetical protein
MSSFTQASTGASSTALVTQTESSYRLPSIETMEFCWNLSIVEDKPLMTDYWTYSIDKTVVIGCKEDGEKLLIKNKHEYTSRISKIFKKATEFVIMTENSIYIVDSGVPVRRINSPVQNA